MSTAAQEAAAALAPGMAAQLVEAMPLAGEDALAADLETRGAAAAPELVPSSQPQTAPVAAAQAPEAVEPVVEEEFDLEPVISDELQALLDEPDFDEEAAVEVQSQIDDGDLDYTTDPEAAARLRKLEKENEWLKAQRVVSDKKKWVKENLKAYPLLNRYAADEVAAIDATSRRAFARQAASLNGRLTKMVAPALQEIADAKKLLRGEADAEVRAEYNDAWGAITTGPSTVPDEAAEKSSEYAAAMKAGNLPKAIGALLRGAGVNNNT